MWLLTLLSIAHAACDETVRGVVVDGDTQDTVAGAVVSVGPPGRLHTTVSGADGTFTAAGQCSGWVRVAATHPDFHASATATDAAEPVTVELYTHEDYEIVVTEAAPSAFKTRARASPSQKSSSTIAAETTSLMPSTTFPG